MIRKVMEVLYPCAAGLDVHKKMVMACRRRLLGDGQVEVEVREFGTTTAQLKQLATWLAEWHCTHVAMESTGVLWVPIWNVLEGQFTLLLANARQLKGVPGRKRDVKDAEWIGQLMPCGLRKPSFVPNAQVRHWRTLTRQRMKLLDQRTSVTNRLHKVLQQGNLKLSSVASDVLGVSGRAILKALIEGESDAETLAKLTQGRLKAPYEKIVEALAGRLTGDQRWVLKPLWEQLTYLEEEIVRYDEQIGAQMQEYDEALKRLLTIDLLERRSVENLWRRLGRTCRTFRVTIIW